MRLQQPERSLSLPGLALILLGLTLTYAGLVAQVSAQEEFADAPVVHLLQEPRHRTVHSSAGLFLLDVQINPGDRSFPHTHNQAILLTRISASDGPRFGAIEVITDYVDEPHTHVVDNPGPELLHILAFVNDGRGVGSQLADQPEGIERAPDIENAWFRAWRLRLMPGESTALQTHRNPTVIIQGSPGLLHVTRTDGITHELDQPGDWAWRDSGSSFIVNNRGDAPVYVAINEGRRAD